MGTASAEANPAVCQLQLCPAQPQPCKQQPQLLLTCNERCALPPPALQPVLLLPQLPLNHGEVAGTHTPCQATVVKGGTPTCCQSPLAALGHAEYAAAHYGSLLFL